MRRPTYMDISIVCQEGKKRAINIRIMHYENAIIAWFQSKTSLHYMVYSADQSILQFSIFTPVHFPISLLPPVLSRFTFPFLFPPQFNLLSFGYLSNFSPTVFFCHSFYLFFLFLFFFFLPVFFPFPSLYLLFSPSLFPLRLIRRWQIHCRLPPSPHTYLSREK